MPILTDEDIEARKAAGVKMKRLNCGWRIPNKDLLRIFSFIESWNPETDAEKRDKKILKYAFIDNMNAQQIARLNDPALVGMGNRSRGKPLSPSSILTICYKYAPEAKQRTHDNRQNKQKRNELFKDRKKNPPQRPKACAACGAKANIELHHIIPLSAGGSNDYFNLINLCHDCHMKLHHEIYTRVQFLKEIK